MEIGQVEKMESFHPILVISLLLMALTTFPPTLGEVFTSMADMEQMVVTEKQMLEVLKDYIDAEEEKLQNIKSFLSDVDGVLGGVTASEDVGKYLGNPVNSYLMLKRFNVEWKNLEKTLEEDLSERLNNVFETLRPFFPTAEDHEGAMDALFRLQQTYNLHARQLSQGVIPGVTKLKAIPLSMTDMFELGAYAYKTRTWEYAIQWFETAIEKMGDRDVVGKIEKSLLMDYLAFSLFQSGKVRKALELTETLAALKPDDGRIASNLEYYRDEVSKIEVEETAAAAEEASEEDLDERETTLKSYRKLCRGESRNLTRREQRHMKCWYRNKHHPLFLIKPQKVERVWVKPEILIFHDIIREDQSEWIKKTAHPKLRRATIQDPITGKLRYADYRVSKSTWLDPNIYPEVAELKRRAEAATGLNLTSAEQLQIANYGLGGHYEPHFDHARPEEDAFTALGMGNRIATLLFYIGTPEAGGATVFTNAHATVFPVRNAAVFWYNLKRNGDGNIWTRHAACPVLAGQKWVSNWWIHEYGQFQRRKCDLNHNW